MQKGNVVVYSFVAFLLTTLAIMSAIFVQNRISNSAEGVNKISSAEPETQLSPSPFKFITYTKPDIQKKTEFTIAMIGDSMTHALGPRGGTFNSFINDLYKPHNTGISIDNYAQGSNNILQVKDQLERETVYWDSTFPPLMSRDIDLILIESFGYNPLSQFGLDDGIKKQTAALDDLMTTLITSKPNMSIVFVATIAPSRENYAKKILLDIPIEDRIKQAEERMSYIKNHIDYAKQHNLPLVNIYEKSLDPTGSGDLKYINPDDFIHPSFEGVDFIGHEIAQYIYDNKILPW